MTRSRSLLPILAAALALTTCSPEYRSGETACAPREPRCPEGFVCSGIRCYLRSDVPEAGTPLGGTGGATPTAGSGGSAGTGGAAPSGGRGGTDGSAGAGGAAPSGGRGGAGGSAGAGGVAPPPGGSAAIKLCNNLVNADDTDFEAELIAGPLRLKALSGTCSPAVAMPCATIPPGNTTLTLQRAIGARMLATLDVTIQAGVEYVALAEFNDMTSMVEIGGGPLTSLLPGARCSTVDYGNFYTPAGGTDAGAPPPRDAGPPPPPPAAGSEVKLCNGLRAADGTPTNLELRVGPLQLTARSGECSPVPNTMCRAIAAGTHPVVLRDLSDDSEQVSTTAPLMAGFGYVFGVLLDPDTDEPVLIRLTGAPAACAAYSPADLERAGALPQADGMEPRSSRATRRRYGH
jgi:hypothetical protein